MIIRTDKALPERNEFDFYPTPYVDVERCLSMVEDDRRECWEFGMEEWSPAPRRILDVGAGEGRWGEVARDLWPEADIWGVELREVPRHESYDRWLTGDGLALLPELRAEGEWFDLVMGNPPFYVAEELVRGGLDLLRTGGRLLFLLRLQFIAGKKRKAGLYTEHPLKDMGILGRVSFTLDGRTNATDFAAFLWQKGWRCRMPVKLL